MADPGTPTKIPESGVEAGLTITIGTQSYTLNGIVGKNIVVEYHATPDTGVDLGNILDIAEGVGKALGVTEIGQAAKDLANAVNTSDLGPLTQIAKVVLTAPIVITDLVINTETNVYQFGFALNFTKLDPPVGIEQPIHLSLDYFSLKVTYVKPKSS